MCKEVFKKYLLEKYLSVEYFDNGGNSMVFRAVHNKQSIAIKVYSKLNDENRYCRFLQELIMISKLNGMNGIVPMLERNESSPLKPVLCTKIKSICDIAYFVMPFYPSTLSKKIGNSPHNDEVDAVQTILKIAKIVKQLHDQNLAHRDLKPDNILIDDAGFFFVADFGLCIDLDNTIKRHTPPTELIGAINYRAPEFLRGRLDQSDHRPGDVFSLGRMLGALIFDEELYNLTDLEFTRKVDTISSSKRKSYWLKEIIKAATNIDPIRRPKIDELITDLESWLMEDKLGSTKAILSKILDSPETIARLDSHTKAEEIDSLYKATKDLIYTTFYDGIQPWKEIIEPLRMRGIGNPAEVSSDTNIDRLGLKELEELPEQGKSGMIRIHTQFSTGSVKNLFLTCSLYIYLNLNDINDQMYTVVPAYALPAEKFEDVMYQLAIPLELKKFSYNDADINNKIIKDLKKAIDSLNDLLFKNYNA
jgi:serine/threonine protein kinase